MNRKELELLYLKFKNFVSMYPSGAGREKLIFWLENEIKMIKMTDKIEIYFRDLNKITQEKILKIFGYKEEKDGNFEHFPIFILEKD